MWEKLKQVFHPIFIFYVLVIYIFASFIWWAYLHIQKNEQTLKDQQLIIELLDRKSGEENPIGGKELALEKLHEAHEKRNWMILGEGGVFLLLLIFGAYKIHSGFLKELQLNRQQRNFLLSITHELKSPLAGLRLSTETMLKHQLPPEKEKQLLTNSMSEIDRLKTLVENLLMAAKLEEEELSLSLLNTDLSELLGKLMSNLKQRFNGKREFIAQIEEGLSINADPFAFSTAINNLLENAVKYSDAGTEIGLLAKKQGKYIQIEVWDRGMGIAESERKKVFWKFYRVGNEETRSTKGTGLGLFIVKEILDLHKGTIALHGNEPQGSRFKISIPSSKSV